MSEDTVSVIGFVASSVLAVSSFFFMRSPQDAGRLTFAWLLMFVLMAWGKGFHGMGVMVLFVVWFVVGMVGMAFGYG